MTSYSFAVLYLVNKRSRGIGVNRVLRNDKHVSLEAFYFDYSGIIADIEQLDTGVEPLFTTTFSSFFVYGIYSSSSL